MVKNMFHSDSPTLNPGLWSIAICSACQQSHYRCHFKFEMAGYEYDIEIVYEVGIMFRNIVTLSSSCPIRNKKIIEKISQR